jgi:hypothetical protein
MVHVTIGHNFVCWRFTDTESGSICAARLKIVFFPPKIILSYFCPRKELQQRLIVSTLDCFGPTAALSFLLPTIAG